MGLFDIFKKKKDKDLPKPLNEFEKEGLNIEYTPEGTIRLKLSYKNVARQYDVTEFVLDPQAYDFAGYPVYDGKVQWYCEDACLIVNNEGTFDRLCDNEQIYTQLDLDLLQNDPIYAKIVMQNLLDKTRVEKYVARGREENPEMPSGRYIGGLKKTENNEYKKFFSPSIGRIAHNLAPQVEERRKIAEEQERRRQAEIDYRKRRIQELQSELNNLER